jgi:hypothetical protein
MVKFTVGLAMKAQRGSFFHPGTRWGWVVNSTPRPLYPEKQTWYPLYRRLSGPQGRSGRLRKISPPPGFDPRTVQPVVSRCTDYAITTYGRINQRWGNWYYSSFYWIQLDYTAWDCAQSQNFVSVALKIELCNTKLVNSQHKAIGKYFYIVTRT